MSESDNNVARCEPAEQHDPVAPRADVAERLRAESLEGNPECRGRYGPGSGD